MNKLAYYETDPKLSKEYAQRLLDHATENNDIVNIYNGYLHLGNAEKYLGNNSLALNNFFLSFEYARMLDRKLECEVLTSIAGVYKANEDYENSFKYYRRAIASLNYPNLTAPELENLAVAYSNAGDAFLTIKNADSALHYFFRAKDVFEILNQQLFIAYVNGNIGIALAEKNQNVQAEKLIEAAVKVLIEYKDYYAVSVYYTYMADIYFEKGQMKQALSYAQQSFEMASKYGLKEQIRDANLKLHELYEAIGDHKKALGFYKGYVAFKDSLVNRESIRQMADLRTEFEVGQKQAELDLVTAQQKTERVIMIGIACLAVVLVVLAIIIFRYYRAKSRINMVLEEQKLQLESLNKTKDKFFSIISHDLRGPVNSFFGISRMIKFLVQSKETDQLLEIADDIDQSVERLSSLLDNLLSWAIQQQGEFPYNPEKVNVKDLAEEITGTFDNMAQGKKINLQYEVDADLALYADKKMAQTIIRNLVNNALKFTPENGSVIISGEVAHDQVHIQIKDTGVGMPEDKLSSLFQLQDKKSTYGTSGEKGLGLGLQLVYEFIERNNGSVEVESREGEGTTFHIKLPQFSV
ncbi:MAG: tetratricopeptide repeat-containing sensor histidine kinase [Cyclobacteriaceae bacterium]